MNLKVRSPLHTAHVRVAACCLRPSAVTRTQIVKEDERPLSESNPKYESLSKLGVVEHVSEVGRLVFDIEERKTGTKLKKFVIKGVFNEYEVRHRQCSVFPIGKQLSWDPLLSSMFYPPAATRSGNLVPICIV